MKNKRTLAKLARIQELGGRVTTVPKFLELTREDEAYIEMRLAWSRKIRETRIEFGWNQTELAARVGSDQSRIAKVERADPSVSFDLLIRSLLALKLEPKDIGSALLAIKTGTHPNAKRKAPVRKRLSKKATASAKGTSKKRTVKKKTPLRR
jgi:transcriptional regulator with XRE-family HTH domain